MRFTGTHIFLAAWMITACAWPSGAGGSNPDDQRAFTAVDNGRHVSMPEGSIFSVALEASAGTGYRWHLETVETDKIKSVDQHSEPIGKEEPGFVGGPYREVWRFKTVSSGSTALQFLYYPSWEGRQTAEKSFTLRITIRP